MSCFVLEVETVVLIKTEDEGHFSQERAPPQNGTLRALKLFFFASLAVVFTLKCQPLLRFYCYSPTCIALTLSKPNLMKVQ